jgi:hypothetical protein
LVLFYFLINFLLNFLFILLMSFHNFLVFQHSFVQIIILLFI